MSKDRIARPNWKRASTDELAGWLAEVMYGRGVPQRLQRLVGHLREPLQPFDRIGCADILDDDV